jgi:hypothetical protein
MNHARTLLAILALGLAGCGGGGGGDVTLTLVPVTALTLNSSGVVQPGPGHKAGQFVTIGLYTGLRFGIFPFLDQDDTIVSARLRVRQVSVNGTPYAIHGDVVVDEVDFGAALAAGDQSPTVLDSAIGILFPDATLGIGEVDVTAQVAAAAAADQFFLDFFLRFDALVLGPPVDYANFEDENGGLGTPDVPQLVVVYR